MTQDSNARYTVAKFADKHKSFATESSLRFMMFKADENRMNEFGVIERMGRRVLLNEAKFFQWLEAINEKPAGRNN